MKIAHVSDYYLPRLGGIELHMHDLALRQRAAGHQVDIVTSAPDPGGAAGQLVGIDGLCVHRVSGRLPCRLPLAPGSLRPGCRLLVEGGYDLVHAHAAVFSPLAIAAAYSCSRAGMPTVVTVHSLWAYATGAFRGADAVTGWSRWPVVWSAVSEAAADPIRWAAGGRTDVAVLPNGVDPAEWQIEPAEREPADVVIVSVMRLAPRKRPMQLVRMLHRVRDLVPSRIRLTAVIIGEGPERRSLERYLRRHGMVDWVTLPGAFSRPEIRAVFRRADFFVAPANLESFGIAALEARCAGLPVLAKANSGISEFVADGREGLLARSDDEMVDAMAKLAGSPELRAAMSSHNRAARPRWTWSEALARNDAAYQSAIQASVNGAAVPPGGGGVAHLSSACAPLTSARRKPVRPGNTEAATGS